MTKEEIIKKLKDNWIKPGGGWKQYEVAKKLICPEEEKINGLEYDYRLEIITEYLNV
ncbi:hypothetical protein KAR91_75645 [Candidatus Pacearchaeota archaeon]|nr:hypothetical protein [Candidatus Pacearchaeota archaeon]